MNRIVRSVCLFAVVLVFVGCPASPFQLGIWIFTITGVDPIVAAEFNSNGTATPPSEIPTEAETTFEGTLNWARNGSIVTINQDSGVQMYQYVGELSNRTAMSGTWQQTAGGNDSGTFSAEWVSN